MNSLQQIKSHKVRFFFQSFGVALFLIGLTSLHLLTQILQQLDQRNSWAAGKIQLFSASEVAELHHYFTHCFWGLALAALLFLTLIVWLTTKKATRQATLSPTSPTKFFINGLAYNTLIIVSASCGLLSLFILAQPLYETLLQIFYQHSLDHFTDLPNFVLSNGTSGFAYSLRLPFSFDISSDRLFHFFLLSLATASLQFFGLSLPVLFGDVWYYRQKNLTNRAKNQSQTQNTNIN